MESKKSLRNQIASAKLDAHTFQAQLLEMTQVHLELMKSIDVVFQVHLVPRDGEGGVALCGVETTGRGNEHMPPNCWVCGECLKVRQEQDDCRYNVMSGRLNSIRLLAQQAMGDTSGQGYVSAMREIFELTEPPADMAVEVKPEPKEES